MSCQFHGALCARTRGRCSIAGPHRSLVAQGRSKMERSLGLPIFISERGFGRASIPGYEAPTRARV
jgi:hypothetical protein